MTMFSSVSVIIVLSCALFAVVHADVSSLRYNRIGRVQSTRLLRQEASPTPYPASGFRPDRQFDFPAQRQPQSAPAAEPQQTNFNQLSPAQQPQLIYGAPLRQPSQPSQRQQQLQLLRSQQQQLQLQQRQIQQLQQLVQEQQQQQQQQQEQQQQEQPQFAYAAPQNTYGAPEASAEASEPQRQTQAKPARLTATREDVEDEEDDGRTDIDADSNDAATTATEGVNKPTARALPQPQPAAGAGTIVYYPAGAVSFVHPAAAAYGLPAAYKLPAANLFAKLQAQPSYYTAAGAQPQLVATQQLLQPQAAAYIAASGQLQAW